MSRFGVAFEAHVVFLVSHLLVAFSRVAFACRVTNESVTRFWQYIASRRQSQRIILSEKSSDTTRTEMAAPTTNIQVVMAQPSKPPPGGIKWKALFDSQNPMSNKILFCNSITSELLPWIGFVRPTGKEFTFTTIPISHEQQAVVNNIEAQVVQLLSQYDWCREFALAKTETIYPKTANCTFYERREDGRLYHTKPVEGDLHNTPEKNLHVGALLHVNGVYFDYAKHTAKLTFKLVSATYSWTEQETAEDLSSSYFAMFGPIVSEGQPKPPPQQPLQQPKPQPLLPSQPTPQQSQLFDAVEMAASVSGIATAQQEQLPFDREAFLTSLSKARSVNGVNRKMRLLQKEPMDSITRKWCESEACRVMYALSKREDEKKRRKEVEEEEEEDTTPVSKKLKPLTLQRQNNGAAEYFKVVTEQSNDSLGKIFDTDNEEEEEED